MNEIPINKQIVLEKFLNRLPPIVRLMFIENINKKYPGGYDDYKRKWNCDENRRTFQSLKNDFTWRETPQGQTFWEYLKSAKIVLDIPFPTGNLGFSINLGDYYCRNEQYESLIKDIKSKKIEEFDIESCKMVIVDVKGIKWS